MGAALLSSSHGNAIPRPHGPSQGVQAVFDVSDTQLDALAGSETLRIEVRRGPVGCV